jgi:hypothetical protein
MLSNLLKELEIQMWFDLTIVIMKDRLEKYSSGTLQTLLLRDQATSKLERGIQNLH